MSDAPEPTGTSERERQRAGIAWALADLDGLRARGVIDARAHDRLRHDYEERLRWLDAAAVQAGAAPMPAAGRRLPPHIPPPPAAPPAALGAAVGRGVAAVALGRPSAANGVSAVVDESAPAGAAPDAPPAAASGGAAPFSGLPAPGGEADGGPPGGLSVPPPAGRAGGFADLWINATLCLGAFFVVIAALIFVRVSGLTLSRAATAGVMLGFTAAFVLGGLVCLRLPKVRPAGHAFLALGAILTPLDIVGLYNFVLADRNLLSAAATWALGSAYCAAFYGALALRRLGPLYAGAAVIAAVGAWGGLIATLDPPTGWLAPLALALPLLLLGADRLLARSALGRAAFGALPALAAHLLTPFGVLATLGAAALLPERWGAIVALALATLFYVAAARARPARDRAARAALIAAALGTGSLLVLLAGYAARIPPRGYPALALANAWALLALAAAARRRAAAWSGVPLAAGMAQAGALLLPWGFLVADQPAAYWAGLFALLLLYTATLLWGLRRAWLLYPAALAAALTLFHALRIGVAIAPAPYAWAFAALALPPVAALRPLRAGGVSRAWDAQLIVIAQALAIAAAALALAGGDRAQLATLLWLFAAAGGVVVLLERREELLALPNAWALVAVAATLDLAGVERRWAEVVYAALGVALALGLQFWRNVPSARRPGWYMAHRWTAGVWAVAGPVLAAINLSGPFERFLAGRELRELVLDYAYGPAMLSVALCGVALAADAIFTLRRPTGYGASAVLAAAALMAIARITPNNPQAYAVPLGVYLLALSVYVAYERDLGPVRMPAANGLLAAAIVVILGTTFAQSLAHPWRYTFLGLAEGLALLAATLFLRRRYGVALTLLGLGLIATRAAFDAARALPNWAIIGLLGLLLLGGGFFILLRRDRIERWGTSAVARWSRLM